MLVLVNGGMSILVKLGIGKSCVPKDNKGVCAFKHGVVKLMLLS